MGRQRDCTLRSDSRSCVETVAWGQDDVGALEWLDVVARELALFAGVGLLIGGLDDLT